LDLTLVPPYVIYRCNFHRNSPVRYWYM